VAIEKISKAESCFGMGWFWFVGFGDMFEGEKGERAKN